MERLKAVPSWQSQGLAQGKGGFFFPKVSLENYLQAASRPVSSFHHQSGGALWEKGRVPCLQGPGRARSTLEFVQCLLNLFALSWRTNFLGHFISPVALLFEGSLLPGQRGAVMNSGSLQSSALLLLPRITYARLAHVRLPAQGGWRESLLQGWWCCLGNSRSGPSTSAPSPGSSSSSPDLSQGWRILSKKPHICRLRVPWNREGHSRACWLLPRLGWLEGGTLWEEREHPQAPGSSQTFQLQAQFLHLHCGSAVVCVEQYQDHEYLGSGQCSTVVLSCCLSPM